MVAAVLILSGCFHEPVPATVDEAVEMYGRYGMADYTAGRYRQATEAWQKGLESARTGGRTADAALFLVYLSQAAEGMGRYDAALIQADQALEIMGEGGDPATRCKALIQKGLAYRRTARYAEARLPTSKARV
jgi:tetratricopeptide (TPR) repeat protein